MKRNIYKVILLGDSAVGKTSLMHSYADQRFLNSYKATIGADMMEKDIAVDGKVVNLIIVDTAGQQKFRSMGQAFYRATHCCILVYDITNKKSFLSIQSWMTQFLNKGSPQQPDNFPFILVGNKCDKEPQRQVSSDDISQFLRRFPKLKHMQISAKNKQGVNQVFEAATRSALQYFKQQIFIPIKVQSKKLSNRNGDKNNKKKVCC